MTTNCYWKQTFTNLKQSEKRLCTTRFWNDCTSGVTGHRVYRTASNYFKIYLSNINNRGAMSAQQASTLESIFRIPSTADVGTTQHPAPQHHVSLVRLCRTCYRCVTPSDCNNRTRIDPANNLEPRSNMLVNILTYFSNNNVPLSLRVVSNRYVVRVLCLLILFFALQ